MKNMRQLEKRDAFGQFHLKCLPPPRPKLVRLLKLAEVALKSWLETEGSRTITHDNP